jgi:uncharacterized protein
MGLDLYNRSERKPMIPDMNTRFAASSRTIDAAQYDEGLRRHMLRVYNYMGGGLAITGLLALLVSSSAAMMDAIFGTPLKWLVMLAPLAFIMVLNFRLHAMSASSVQALFWTFCAVMGVSMASIFIVYTGTSIARVFFITGAMFAGVSLWGYTTKRDLTGMGGFLMMGLIGLMIASIVNIFLGSAGLQFAVSVIGVIVFTGMAAWNTQQIKETYDEGMGVEDNQKLAVMGALGLYLDFINLFQMLLSLLGNRRD